MGGGSSRWRTIEHTADLAVEIEASAPEALFVTAAYAMIGVLRGEEAGELATDADAVGGVGIQEWRRLELGAADREALLVEWLRELLYLAVAEPPLFVRVAEIEELNDSRLRARVGFAGSEAIAAVERELKGVTYHDLELGERDGRWLARVVFDV